ncbi:ribulose-phosphate 3-epimerase, partial [bacterium]|nr:ribulose-phosphate 3-epimerase [bacterium]
FGGQSFMSDCAEKIKFIRQNAPEDLIIQVDGGINAQTGKICKDFGANSLVAGSYIYGASDIKQAIDSLK